MNYWFTTQYPKVLDYKNHGVWVSEWFKNSGKGLRRNDEVAIYEVQQVKGDVRKNGAKAVVAIVRVDRIITPPRGPDDYGFLQIAEASLIAKDDQGLPAEKVLV